LLAVSKRRIEDYDFPLLSHLYHLSISPVILHFIMTDLPTPAYLTKEGANSRQVENYIKNRDRF